MSNNEAPEQKFDPRHRIVGAVIIVTLAVIIVPLILDKNEWEPRQPDKQTVSPPADTSVVITRVEDLRRKNQTADAADGGAAVKVDDRKASETSKLPDKAVSETTVKKTETVAKPAPKKVAKPVARKADMSTGEGWVVQLGTFANKKNVERMRSQLSSRGYKVNTETVQLSSGPATRVRVGPFGRKTQAETMRKRIESELGLKGSVLAAR